MLAEVAKLERAFEHVDRRLQAPGRRAPAITRAARWTSIPTYSSLETLGSPLWMPIRTDTDFVQAILRLDRGRDGVRRSLEDDEERVAAGVEHDAIVSGDCGAHHAVVLGEETGVVVAELVQQSRGALDVGEEEGDCSGREVEHADRMRVGPPDC